MQVLEILSLVIDEELVLEELLRTPGLISNAAACMTARSQELTLLVFALDSSLYRFTQHVPHSTCCAVVRPTSS